MLTVTRPEHETLQGNCLTSCIPLREILLYHGRNRTRDKGVFVDYSTASRKIGIAAIVNNLTRTTPLSDISVNDIAEQSGISRATFYRIFPDRASVVTETSELVFRLGAGRIGSVFTWHDGLLVSLSGIELFWNMFRASRSTRPNTFTDAAGLNAHKQLLKANLTARGVAVTERLDFQMSFYGSKEMDIIAQWVLSDNPMPKEQLVDLLVSCVPAELFAASEIPESLGVVHELDYASLIMEATKYL